MPLKVGKREISQSTKSFEKPRGVKLFWWETVPFGCDVTLQWPMREYTDGEKSPAVYKKNIFVIW